MIQHEISVTAAARRVLSEPARLTEDNAPRLQLRRQWAVLPLSDSSPRQGWIQRPLNSAMQLVHHPEARVEFVGEVNDGIAIIGLAVVPDRPALSATELFASPEDRCEAAIVKSLRALGGTYAVLRYDNEDVWVYTDPGMMGVYYARGRAASTPALLPDLRRDEHVDRVFHLGRANEWYPGSLTPFEGVRALLANHRLRVATGEIERFWPMTEAIWAGSNECIDRICEILRGMMLGVSSRGELLLGLTGGRDSRTVLSAARPIIDACRVFTLRSDRTEPGDLLYPAMMASQFHLCHQFVDVPPPPAWLVRLYDEMTCGMVVGASRQVVESCRRLSTPSCIHINGALGELAMPYYWHSAQPKTVRLKSLAKKQGSKPTVIMQALAEWHASVPRLKPTTVYNLMHLEQLGGRWWSAVETAGNLFYESFTPFCHRELFECLCALPPRMVYANGLRAEFVRRLWPQLLEVPYCKPARRLSALVPRGLKERAKWVVDRDHRRARRADAELPEVTTIRGLGAMQP